MRKGIMAMEGLEEVIDQTEATEPSGEEEVAAATDFVEAPEGDLVEAEAAGGELDQIEEASAEAEETADTLENIGEAVEASVEEGGLSEPAAEAVRIAVEHFRNRLSFPANAKKVFPAMEGFKAPGSDRVRATKIVLEGIKETVAKIWEALVKIAGDAWEWLKKFAKHVMDGAVRLKTRAEQLAAAAEKAEGKNAADKISGSWAKVLFGANDTSGAGFEKNFNDHIAAVEGAQKASAELAKKGQEGVSALLYGLGDRNAFEKAQGLMVKAFSNAAQGDKSSNKDLGGEGLEVFELKFPFGGQSLFSVVPTTGAALGSGKFVVSGATGAELKDVSEAGAIPSTKSIAAVAKAAAEHLGTYEGFAGDLKAIEKAQSDVAAKAKDLRGKPDSEGAAETARAASKAARAYISAVTSGARGLRSYDLSVINAALAYAGASLKLLTAGEKAAEPKKEEAAPAAA